MTSSQDDLEADAPPEAEVARLLSDLIARGDESDEAFDRAARALFRYQYAHNEPYARFCRATGITPDRVRHWREIAPAPVLAFKRAILSCTPPEDAARVFHSSGTTGHATSRHFLSPAALGLYEQSLRAGFTRFVLPDGSRLPIWALLPPPELVPHSSLTYMAHSLMRADPSQPHRWFWAENGPDSTSLARALRAADHPVLLFGTAFAWILFFDAGPHRFGLPDGSRVIETGGFKGRTREVPRDELYRLFADRLGAPPTHCLSEYGMSEMCSQFYDSTLIDHFSGRARTPRKVGPPWARTRVLDPATGLDARLGEPGLLCHYDLANLNSVLALCTEDWGRLLDEGFELLGRAPEAELRGCSLTAEEWHARA